MKQKLSIQSKSGATLSAVLSNPTEDKNNLIVVFCHGFLSSKEKPIYNILESILNKENVSTLRFDLYGHGESTGKLEDVTVSKAVDDALSVLNFIKEQGYTNIGLFGSSFGGMAAIITASKIDNLKFLILKAPVSDLKSKLSVKYKDEVKDWKKRGWINRVSHKGNLTKLNYSFFEDSGKHDCYELAKKIRVSTLIIHGELDESVPLEQSKKTASLIKNSRLEIIPGSNHMFSKKEHYDKTIDLTINFILKFK